MLLLFQGRKVYMWNNKTLFVASPLHRWGTLKRGLCYIWYYKLEYKQVGASYLCCQPQMDNLNW